MSVHNGHTFSYISQSSSTCLAMTLYLDRGSTSSEIHMVIVKLQVHKGLQPICLILNNHLKIARNLQTLL